MSSPILRFRVLSSRRPHTYKAEWFEANAERIITLRKSGLGINAIAADVNGNWQVVQKVLREAGLYETRPRYSPAIIEQKKREANYLLSIGWKMKAIARELGVARNTLRYWFNESRSVGVQADGQMAMGKVSEMPRTKAETKDHGIEEAMRAFDAGVDLIDAANCNDVLDTDLLSALKARRQRVKDALEAYAAADDASLADLAITHCVPLQHLRDALTLRNTQRFNVMGAPTLRQRDLHTTETV